MNIDALSPDKSILKELGRRLARVRKQQGLSQTKLALQAGIGVATLRRIEAGQDSQMETWIKVLKSLSMLAALDALLPENYQSPMQEVLSDKKRNNQPRDSSSAIKWGDESA